MGRAAIVMLGIVLGGCSKANEAPASPVDAGTPAPGASAAPAPSAAPSGVGGAWSGRYTASPGPFSVPDGGEWAGVKFRGEDASVGLGDGTLAVSVDPTGRAQGTLEGPLGPLRIRGEIVENAFSAALVPGEPAQGFSGTAVGSLAGGKITGTMHLSLPTGNVLREASFTLERQR